jgi:glycerol-3-phosphate cytidylyltransferase-like family protein
MIDQDRVNAYVAKLQAAGHVLKRTPDGRPDLDAWDFDTHCGPSCERCDGAWCIYCESTVERCRPFRLGILASAFDPFHPGYLWAMKQALDAGACEAVVVAIHRDPSIERPAKRRPALTLDERAAILREFRQVHHVLTYETEQDLVKLILKLKPACLIVGADHQTDRVTGTDLAPVFWAKRKPEWSGTQMARRIHDAYVEHQNRQIARESTVALQAAVQSWVAAKCPCRFPEWDGSQTGGNEATMQEFGGSQGGAAMIAKFGAPDDQTAPCPPSSRDQSLDGGVST